MQGISTSKFTMYVDSYQWFIWFYCTSIDHDLQYLNTLMGAQYQSGKIQGFRFRAVCAFKHYKSMIIIIYALLYTERKAWL